MKGPSESKFVFFASRDFLYTPKCQFCGEFWSTDDRRRAKSDACPKERCKKDLDNRTQNKRRRVERQKTWLIKSSGMVVDANAIARKGSLVILYKDIPIEDRDWYGLYKFAEIEAVTDRQRPATT